ncbi:MAG: hypothetical protein FD175_2580 [Beijerinckiaceae bacterium]|nr:MAG: hypothetical protein FD175_2580 [Beijerinckiaceae bacterium]
MDHNLAFSCIGYGSVRVLRERKFSTAPFAVPANWILEKSDPVQFCIDALKVEHPDWVEKIDDDTRRVIHLRLKKEARRAALHS